MATAGELLEIWSHRLRMNQTGITKMWPAPLRSAVEELIEKLEVLPVDEPIELHAGTSRDTIARFVRSGTGEVVGEIKMPPEIYEEN